MAHLNDSQINGDLQITGSVCKSREGAYTDANDSTLLKNTYHPTESLTSSAFAPLVTSYGRAGQIHQGVYFYPNSQNEGELQWVYVKGQDHSALLRLTTEGKLQTLSTINGATITDTSFNGATIDAEGITLDRSQTISAGRFNALSDIRLKENFQPLTSEKSILDLPTYKFDFINGAKNQIGCKAQDLQEICPEIVNEGKDGYLSIQESKIVYLLLEEVKKLRQEIDELKKG